MVYFGCRSGEFQPSIRLRVDDPAVGPLHHPEYPNIHGIGVFASRGTAATWNIVDPYVWSACGGYIHRRQFLRVPHRVDCTLRKMLTNILVCTKPPCLVIILCKVVYRLNRAPPTRNISGDLEVGSLGMGIDLLSNVLRVSTHDGHPLSVPAVSRRFTFQGRLST